MPLKMPSVAVSGAVRPVVESVRPEINGGRYPIKRVKGDRLRVEATAILDGHDLLSCFLLYRHESDRDWSRVPMPAHPTKKDLFEASFEVDRLGQWQYTVQACVDRFGTWSHELEKRHEGGQDLEVEFLVGIEILKAALSDAKGKDAAAIKSAIAALKSPKITSAKKVAMMVKGALPGILARYPDLALAADYDRLLEVTVEPVRAAFSSWYEFFPRSMALDGKTHGTFKDCEKMLPYVASMGFDTIYLPPIHPIGFAHRKGKNNSLEPRPQDPGSAWGIGAASGGHKAIHPELGSLADFRRFVKKANSMDMEVAMDIAFQCSPDHPYVKEHPEWFKKKPDGSIQYAENPPKKYQDIYPFHFETEAWPALWTELKDIVLFWIKQGVTVFRVDNPHTKAFGFWKWMIAEVKKEHPETIFLSEAFTRPAVMYHLAKIGFSQSYTYFTWRNTPAEFKKYMEELTQTEVAEFYRPNFWPNTPDILPIHLQKGGRPAFLVRVALAATLSSNYGIYGPAYELLDNTCFKEGGEEYLNSEKYELKAWDLKSKHSIRDFIGKLNKIRKSNRALHRTENVRFHPVTNDQIACYTRHTSDLKSVVLVATSLDFAHQQSGEATLALESVFGGPVKSIVAQDLLTGKKTVWKDSKPKFSFDPAGDMVRIFRLTVKK